MMRLSLVLWMIVLASTPALAADLEATPGSLDDAKAQWCSAGDSKETFCKIRVDAIHPTQMAVGIRLMREKQNEIARRKDDSEDLKKYLKKEFEPVVIGPEGHFYIVDHHHFARALWEEKIEATYATILANFSHLNVTEFWREMEQRHWVFPFDENGKGPQPIDHLPAFVWDLKDDPYRSLSGEVRREGGYDKTDVFFADFYWANFFRPRVVIGPGDQGFDQAVEDALLLAHSPEARDLPGYLPESTR